MEVKILAAVIDELLTKRRGCLMKRLLLIALLIPGLAMARPVTIQWTFNAVDCDGVSVDPSQYESLEIYFDTVPIPAADAGCRQDGATPDVVPVGATQIAGVPTDNQVTADIPPGEYFIRARVFMDGEPSQLSAQTMRTVSKSEPMVIILTL